MNSNVALIARLYHTMSLIRKVEEYIVDVYNTDVIKSPVHLSIGQEAIPAAVCEALSIEDLIAHTYRCHGSYIAKGGDLNKMFAELYGKKGGCANGKAGSMHLVDMSKNILGASAVVGTTIPVSAGFALAYKRNFANQPRVAVSFFGDGATEEGCFSEALNFAALHKLPLLFVCENNGLAINTPINKRWPTEKLCERVETYGIKTIKTTDKDVIKLYETVKEIIDDIKSGKHEGPVFIECETYRWFEHVGPADDHFEDYRCEKEYDEWKSHCQIKRLGGMLSREEKEEIDIQIEKAIKEAIAFAKKCNFPGEEELASHVFAK